MSLWFRAPKKMNCDLIMTDQVFFYGEPNSI